MNQINDRTIVINEYNHDRLIELYGAIYSNELCRIVNKHIEVAIEIIEDENKIVKY